MTASQKVPAAHPMISTRISSWTLWMTTVNYRAPHSGQHYAYGVKGLSSFKEACFDRIDFVYLVHHQFISTDERCASSIPSLWPERSVIQHDIPHAPQRPVIQILSTATCRQRPLTSSSSPCVGKLPIHRAPNPLPEFWFECRPC